MYLSQNSIRRIERVVAPLISFAIFAVAGYALYKVSGEIDLADVRSALADTKWSGIIWASVFTVLSIVSIGLYDVIAVERVAPGRVPAPLAMFAGAVGHAIAIVAGSDVLVGGPVRYRVYAPTSLNASDLARIIAINLVTFWLGLLALVAVALIFDPTGMTALRSLAPTADRIVGVALLAAIALFVVWLWRSERRVVLFRWQLPLPHRSGALQQIAVGAADIAASAAALYVLLPADIQPAFVDFAILFAIAIIASVVSHVPAGLGVVEATVLIGLGAGNRPDVIAALLVFRLIYYLVPFLIAVAAFALFEAWQARRTSRT